MNTERDKFLTEAMGWPWHEVVSIDNFKVTCSCGMSGYMNPCDNLNFSTWDGFGKLWTWAQKQEWFDLFQCCLYCTKGEVHFVRGRLKFGGSANSAPFPSAVVVFRPRLEDVAWI